MTIATIQRILRAAGHRLADSELGSTGERDSTSEHRWWFEPYGTAMSTEVTVQRLERALDCSATLNASRGGWELHLGRYTILVYLPRGNPNADVELTTVFVEKE